jgi:ABC-2 type transport system permease protein
MPIYDQGYRRYEAREALRRVRFWPITREALRLILSRRAFLGLLMIAWVPFLARVIQVYVVTRFPEAGRVLPVDGRLFGEFLAQQSVFTLFLTVFGGAGLIANDLRTGAILVYLSRPLTRRDYVLGKLGTLLALNLSVTLVPGLLLYLVALSLAPAQFLKADLAWIGPAIVLQSLMVSVVTSLVALAVSSLSRSARVAGLGFFGLLMGLELARGILRAVYDRRPETLLVSLRANMQAVGNALFGIQSRAFDIPWMEPAAVLLLVSIGCLMILRSRVRAVEIVR